jgi:hypothetical protein
MKIITFIEKNSKPEYKVYLSNNRNFCKDNGIEFEVIEYISEYDHPSIDKDFAIFKLAELEEYKDVMFIDADVKLIKVSEFNNTDFPYFGSVINCNGIKVVSTCLVYVNNCMEFFKQCNIEYKNRKIQPVYNHYHKILRDKKVNIIDVACYDHDKIELTKKYTFIHKEIANG